MIGLAMLLAGGTLRVGAQETRSGDESGISPAIGLHYGTPLRASLAAGLLIDRSDTRNDGAIVMLEQGFQGSELSLGYFRMFSWFGSGYSLRAAVLRTGDEPWNATEHTTYVGVEAHTMLAFGVGARAGFMRRASHSSSDPHDTIITLGASIGH